MDAKAERLEEKRKEFMEVISRVQYDSTEFAARLTKNDRSRLEEIIADDEKKLAEDLSNVIAVQNYYY